MLTSVIQVKITKFASFLKELLLIWNALSNRRHAQIWCLQAISLVSAFCEIVNVSAIAPFLNLLANNNSSIAGLGTINNLISYMPNKYRILLLGVVFIVIVILSVLLRIVTIRYQLKMTSSISTDIGVKVFTSLLSRSYSWHTQNNSSKLLTYVTDDIVQVSNVVQAILVLGVNLTIVFALGTTLSILSPKLIPAVIISLTIIYYIIFCINRNTLSRYSSLYVSNYQESIKTCQEALGSIRDIIIESNQHFFVRQYRQNCELYRSATAVINYKAQCPRYLIEGFLIIVVTAYAVILALYNNSIESQLPLIGVLTLGSYRILGPLQQCYGAISALQSHKISIKRLRPFLVSDTSTISKYSLPNPASSCSFSIETSRPLICLEDVSFSYHKNSHQVLEKINLNIFEGERIAIVGPTGCGKSTLVDLMLGLLQPKSGTLYVNGYNLNQSAEMIKSWQSHISHVPQHIYLVDSTFAENIAFAKDPSIVDIERLNSSAEQSHLLGLIKSSAHGFETLIGERGIRLSGGQRQRIGLARALYKNSKVIILDEATNALDTKTESDVLQTLFELDPDSTIIMITHRVDTLKHCNRIIFIDNGSIEADGSFNELIESSLKFRNMIDFGT